MVVSKLFMLNNISLVVVRVTSTNVRIEEREMNTGFTMTHEQWNKICEFVLTARHGWEESVTDRINKTTEQHVEEFDNMIKNKPTGYDSMGHYEEDDNA